MTEKHIPQPERFKNVAKTLERMARQMRKLANLTEEGWEMVSAHAETGMADTVTDTRLVHTVVDIKVRRPPGSIVGGTRRRPVER